MSPQEKLERTFELSDSVRVICDAGVRSELPEASDREVFLRLTQRTLGNELPESIRRDSLTMESSDRLGNADPSAERSRREVPGRRVGSLVLNHSHGAERDK
jgi:hypothetical protein